MFHHQSHTSWDKDLPWLSMAFNTAIHESTHFTPDKLFLGRDLRSPLHVAWDLNPEGRGDTSLSGLKPISV